MLMNNRHRAVLRPLVQELESRRLLSSTALQVYGGGIYIADGASTPLLDDGTGYGTVDIGSPAPEHTFLVYNDGPVPLDISNLTVPDGFQLIRGPGDSVAPGAIDSFIVRLNTSVHGTFAGDVNITWDDGDLTNGEEYPYNFAVRGTVFEETGPEAVLRFGQVNIASGDTTPDASKGTDFGAVWYITPKVQHTFDIYNMGASPLAFGPLTLPTGFTLVQGLPTMIVPGASTSFTIGVDTTSTGVFSGTVALATNDPQANPFTFDVQVNIVPIAEIQVAGNTREISQSDLTPNLLDGTDFGTVTVNATPPRRTYTITNIGIVPLNIGTLNLPEGYILVKAPAPALDPGASDTFTVQLQTDLTGTFAGNISFWTNDGDGGDGQESPFTFAVHGAVTKPDRTPPSTRVALKAMPKQGSKFIVFTVTYSDPSLVRASSIVSGGVYLTGPNRFSRNAALVSRNPVGDARTIVATYRVAAPGGAWDPSDNAAYAVRIKAGHVVDRRANVVPAGKIGAFSVRIAPAAPSHTPAAQAALALSPFTRVAPLFADASLDPVF